MKGIILAGGKGSRLYPMTNCISKQLLPIYDKPMIYYPLSILMLCNIKDILIISTQRDLPLYKTLFGDGSQLGLNIEYAVQEVPRGLADAFIIGEKFIGKDNVCLILGDNIFYGGGITKALQNIEKKLTGAIIFGIPVKDPKAFGVIEFDKNLNVKSIEEKPVNPKSNYAVPGLYFYDNEVINIAKKVKPSHRGELEITSINNEYIKRKSLKAIMLGRGVAWLDTGTPSNLSHANTFIECIQNRQGYYVACLEEIAYRQGFINLSQLKKLGENLQNSEYGKYILDLVNEELKEEYK